MRKRLAGLVSGTLSTVVFTLCASDAQRLRWLPTPESVLSSRAFGVDNLSGRIAGTVTLQNSTIACYWDNIHAVPSGPVYLSDIPARANAVNAHGTIAGTTFINQKAFQYAASTLAFLANPYGNFPSQATAISTLGSVIVGGVQSPSGTDFPAYWLNGVPHILPGGAGIASGISPDGTVIVGQVSQAAAIWNSGVLNIIRQAPSQAFDASIGGNTVVGRSGALGFAYENGLATPLPPLVGHSSSNARSIDSYAQIIVGNSNATHAVMWLRQQDGGWRVVDLNQVCQAQLFPGDRLISADSVSPDGRYIVGFGYRAATRRNEAFLLDMSGCPVLLGDATSDGIVDNADLLTVLFNFGSSGNGDINNDGIVDDADLLIILFNFGAEQSCGDCCEATLLIYNTLPNIARIVLTPDDASIIREAYLEDEDDAWQVRKQPDGSLVISHANGVLPTLYGEMQDEILHLRLSRNASLTAKWYDDDGRQVKQERLTAPCVLNSDLNEEDTTQWQINRQYVSGVPDSQAFCGFVPDACDPDEHDLEARVGSVDFSWQFECSDNIPRIVLQVSNPDSAASYTWKVKIDGQEQSYNGTLVTAVIPSNAQEIQIELIMSTTSGGQSQSIKSEKRICLPTAAFDASPAIAVCDSNGNITGYKVRVTPKGLCPSGSETVNIVRYQWIYASTSSSGTGNPTETELMLPATATGTQEIRLSLDLGGCTRTVTKRVQVINPCAPRFRVKYTLCNTSCQAAGDTIPVTFVCTNLSRNDCTTYEWSFGGGSWIPNNSPTVTHTVNFNKYELWNQDCTPRERTYTIRLRATNRSCPSGVIYALSFVVRPVRSQIQLTVCPDGRTYFCADNNNVQWSNGANLPSGWWLAAQFANLTSNRCFDYDLDSGNYTVNALFTDPQDVDQSVDGAEVVGECMQSRSFTVQEECCDLFKHKGRENFTHAGKNYRIYYKHKEKPRDFVVYEDFKLSAKTKLKRERRVGSISYYTWSRADEVEVHVTTNLRSSGFVNQNPCNCTQPMPTSVYSAQKSRSSKAKLRLTLPKGLGIHKDDSLCSVHRVKIGNFEKSVRLFKPAGAYCDGVQVTNDTRCP